MKYFTGILMGICLLFTQQGCRKHPPDPCDAQTANTADFSTYDIVNNINGTEFREDTILGRHSVRFEVNDPAVEKVFWEIGNDPTARTSKSFVVNFSQVTLPSTVMIRCVTYRKAPAGCTAYKEWDTVVKPLHFKDGTTEPGNIYGNWKGSYTDNEGGERVVTIRMEDSSNYASCDIGTVLLVYNTIANLHTTCDESVANCRRPIVSASNNQFRITPSSGLEGEWDPWCKNTNGKGSFDPKTGIITIQFTYGKPSVGYISKTFTGTRVP